MTEASTSRKITQELNRLQKDITIKLEQFYNKNIKGSQLPPEIIKQKYGDEIEKIVRNTVQSSWLFSGQIMETQTNQKVFISSADGAGMERVSNEMVDQYWQTSGKIWLRENEYKVDKNSQLVELNEFDMHAGMVGIGLLIAYYAYNQGMFSKSQELGNVKLKFVTRENCIDTAICLPLNGQIYDIGAVINQPPLHRHCRCRLIPVRV